jgi:hypothetical protein
VLAAYLCRRQAVHDALREAVVFNLLLGSLLEETL